MSSSVPEPALGDARPLPAPAEPHFSLLRLSAGERVAGAAGALAFLWLAVWWAL
jgi:hypothetical protein